MKTTIIAVLIMMMCGVAMPTAEANSVKRVASGTLNYVIGVLGVVKNYTVTLGERALNVGSTVGNAALNLVGDVFDDTVSASRDLVDRATTNPLASE